MSQTGVHCFVGLDGKNSHVFFFTVATCEVLDPLAPNFFSLSSCSSLFVFLLSETEQKLVV